MKDYLKELVRLQKSGEAVGIYSACTGNSLVLEACMRHALETNTVLLIESTANQVDQYGGTSLQKKLTCVAHCAKVIPSKAHQARRNVSQFLFGR